MVKDVFRRIFAYDLAENHTDRCDIYETIPATVTSGGGSEVVVLTDEPCRLCFLGLRQAQDSNSVSKASARAKLFLRAGVPILPGSRVVVRRGTTTYNLASTGVCAEFFSHTEVPLEVAEEIL